MADISTLIKDPEQNERKHLHKFADFSNKRVLEIGCGEGRLTWQYAPASSLTIGLDSDPDALRVASIDSPSDLKRKVFFSRAQAEHLPFSKIKFDIAILAWSF
jgi:ubiquinone/menaquinone biosynthesis C-methylase UbiE